MTLDDIDRILTRLEATDVTECVIEHGAETVRVRFERAVASVTGRIHARVATAAVELETEPETVGVSAPAVGRFRQVHPLTIGEDDSRRTLRSGQHLGYVEVDSVYCAIVASADGIRKTILVNESELVGYGQKVMELSIDFLEAPRNGND